MLELVFKQYFRARTKKTELFLKRYFPELSPMAYKFNLLKLVVSYLSYASCTLILIFLIHEHPVEGLLPTRVLGNFKPLFFLAVLLIAMQLSKAIYTINFPVFLGKKATALEIQYKLILGQDYLAPLILLIIISFKSSVGISSVFIIILIPMYLYFVKKNRVTYIDIGTVVALLIQILNTFATNLTSIVPSTIFIAVLIHTYNYIISRNSIGGKDSLQIKFKNVLLNNHVAVCQLGIGGFYLQYLLIITPFVFQLKLNKIFVTGLTFICIGILLIFTMLKNVPLLYLDYYGTTVAYLQSRNTKAIYVINKLRKNNTLLIFTTSLIVCFEIFVTYGINTFLVILLTPIISLFDTVCSIYTLKELSSEQMHNIRMYSDKPIVATVLVGFGTLLLFPNPAVQAINSIVVITIFLLLYVMLIILKNEAFSKLLRSQDNE